MENIKNKIMSLLIKKYALGYLVKGWEKLSGYKTQIFCALWILTYIGDSTGQIPKDVSQKLYEIFGTGTTFSFLQKLKRYQPVVENVVAEIKQGETK